MCSYWSKKKSALCSGCLHPIETGLRVHNCIFSKLGFTVRTQSFQPYNACIMHDVLEVETLPFLSFWKVINGFQHSSCTTNLPLICELCATRNYLGRKLDPHLASDMSLLALERMRMIDDTHAWAPGTLENACRNLWRIDKFFTSRQLPSLHVQLELSTLSRISLSLYFGEWSTAPPAHPLVVTIRLLHGILEGLSALHCQFVVLVLLTFVFPGTAIKIVKIKSSLTHPSLLLNFVYQNRQREV